MYELLRIESECSYRIPLKLESYDSRICAVGIDFGTTECCVAVIRNNGPHFISLDAVTSSRSMPSYVAYDEEKPKCGQVVINRLRNKAEYSVYDIKRIMGKYYETVVADPLWPFKVLRGNNGAVIEVITSNGTEVKSCEEIASDLLRHIKTAADNYQGKILTDAVITVPSRSTNKQKMALKIAAEYAGFKTIHFVPEPVAAAFAYITESPISEKCNILVCDCGGGTVDICVANVSNKMIDILCFDGDSYLGGRDFDTVLFTHFNSVLKNNFGIDVNESNKKYILKQNCQNIKHNLSVADEDLLDVSDFNIDRDEVISITRKEFEEMSRDLMLRFKNVVIRAITKAHLRRNQINYVFQVGGGCRMPMIKEMLREIFPKSIHQCSLYPDWVVAHGAALSSYYIELQKKQNNVAENAVNGPCTVFLYTIRAFVVVIIVLYSSFKIFEMIFEYATK